jgi:threonine dehydratase
VKPTLADVLAARDRLAPYLSPTPLERSERLSAVTGREVLLKREDLQPVRSYKVRGALNHVLAVLETGKKVDSFVTASAGNHAQGLAYACRALQIPGTVVLPSRTPRQKRDRIQAIGGDLVQIVVHGSVFDDASVYAQRLAQETDAEFVPAFNSSLVVAGQGTVGLEIASALEMPSLVLAPVGGGGLLAGLHLALHQTAHTLKGVEPVGASSMLAALSAGRPVLLDGVDSFCDGVAVRQVGDIPFGVLSAFTPRDIFTVEEGAVATAMLELYQADGVITEPAGALAVAALSLLLASNDSKQPVVCVVSGSNHDVSRYAEVIERSLVHRGLKHYFLVEFDQTPGALRRFLDSALGPDDDIVLFEYTKKSNRETGPALVGVELAQPEGLKPLLERMTQTGIRYELLPSGSPLQRFLV